MYDINNFGQRLQTLRKQKNMTQEELANRVGVTGQAVSKWETTQSYPDITIIPAIAEILDTSISFLFGEQPKSHIADDCQFPASHENLPLVHSNGQVACYSSKQVESTDNSGVKFSDGSTAELVTRMAINKGSGEILFISHEDINMGYPRQKIDTSVTGRDFEFGCCKNVSIRTLYCKCKLVRSPDDKTRVLAKGSPKFMHMLEVYYDGNAGTVSVGYKQEMNGNGNNFQQFNKDERDNELIVQVPFDTGGGHLELHLDCSGDIVSEIEEFDTGWLTINGSGDIVARNFVTSCDVKVNGSGDISAGNSNELSINVNGSGDVSWNMAEKARIKINGSGDISLAYVKQVSTSINGSGDVSINELAGEANDDFSAKIHGSGDISVESGTCNKFDVDIIGSGDVNAENVTARKAHIVLHNSGSVKLGRVIESSIEQIVKKGKITILNRGE